VTARARGRTSGQKGKLTPRQAKAARAIYDGLCPNGRPAHTVAETAAELGVSRPTIYPHLQPKRYDLASKDARRRPGLKSASPPLARGATSKARGLGSLLTATHGYLD
jgi:DNA invertase Pin-like site-specific DNA recombinase